MRDYEFILKFRLSDADADPGQFIDALAEAGCDDATIGIGQCGRIDLDFAREAPSALEAIFSAVEAVRRAIPNAQLIEASPDLVGLTDVADLIGCSRQNMRKLMLLNASSFPVAVHEGSLSLWHLQSVLAWFANTQRRPVDRMLVEVAEATMKVNIAKEVRCLPGTRLPKALGALFA